MSRVILIIQEKITEEQLMTGKTVEIVYETLFNGKTQTKIFPNDFSPEEQLFFKSVYDDAVYGSEIETHIYKCKNIDNNITLEIKNRYGMNPDDLQVETNEHVIKFKITKFGFETQEIFFEALYSEAFTTEVNDLLLTLGVVLDGVSNNFTVTEQLCDIAIEVLKENNDSYINLDNFVNGKTIILHTA